jgi:8-oxo-dGTP diphosphatase
MKTIEVVAAIILTNGKVLCMQRNHSKYDYVSHKFEFPGGKVEPGEIGSIALMREISEEMDLKLTVNEQDYFMTVDHEYPDFNLIMHAYLCRTDRIDFKMNEHIAAVWSTRDTIKDLDWAGADVPIVEKLVTEDII